MIQKRTLKKTFSLAAYRNLRKFVGELTAAATGNEIALRTTAERFAEESLDNWSILGTRLGLKVDGLETDQLIASCSRLHIVSLYSGWDSFIRFLRTEYQELFSETWQHNDGDTPFNEIYRNRPGTGEDLKQKIFPNRQQAIEYYRKIRNAIVHPTLSTTNEVEEHFAKYEADLIQVRHLYGMHSSPNRYGSINIHDVKLLARLVLDVGAVISESFDPGDARLIKVLPLNLWKGFMNNEQKYQNKILGYLRTEFGLDDGRAEHIVSQIKAL